MAKKQYVALKAIHHGAGADRMVAAPAANGRLTVFSADFGPEDEARLTALGAIRVATKADIAAHDDTPASDTTIDASATEVPTDDELVAVKDDDGAWVVKRGEAVVSADTFSSKKLAEAWAATNADASKEQLLG